jgi:nitrite reductase/ring-hydroxylating ferredoxin subunit
MGTLFRRFWLPAMLSEEVPGADCAPVRLRLLGENLVGVRDTNGTVGILDAYCPHRGAPLFFGRNEECGLRCVYHGWKFNVHGTCDVHKESLAVASVAQAYGAEVVSLGPVGTRQGDIDKLIRPLQAKSKQLVFVYDAGPCGYGLYRSLTTKGSACGASPPPCFPKRRGTGSKPTGVTPGTWLGSCARGTSPPCMVPPSMMQPSAP